MERGGKWPRRLRIAPSGAVKGDFKARLSELMGQGRQDAPRASKTGRGTREAGDIAIAASALYLTAIMSRQRRGGSPREGRTSGAYSDNSAIIASSIAVMTDGSKSWLRCGSISGSSRSPLISFSSTRQKEFIIFPSN